jgi:hypothetical protein
MNDIWHVILLQLELHDLKNLIINKQFNNILNDDYFWCRWLKKYNIETSKNCKYIATHIDTNLLYEFNFRNAVKKEYIPVIKYYLDNLDQYEDIDVDYLYFRLIRDNNTYILNQLASNQPSNIDHMINALAYEKYDILKILLHYTQLLPLDLKIKLITLIDENKNHDYFSDEGIAIKKEIDNLFDPYITKNNFAAWRGDFLY